MRRLLSLPPSLISIPKGHNMRYICTSEGKAVTNGTAMQMQMQMQMLRDRRIGN